jgi:tetratricopeptide (TPR) repeat protein
MQEVVKKYQSYLQKKAQANPQDVNAFIHLGILEFEYFHNHDQAIAFLEKAIQIDPSSISAKFWMAMCLYYDFGEYEKAEAVVNEILKLKSDHTESLSLMAWIIRGLNRPLTQAIDLVRTAIAYQPDWPMLRCQLATFLFLVGDIKHAQEEIDKIFQIPSLDPQKTTNEVERYYESVVTGRSWSNKEKKGLTTVQDLENLKSRQLDS